MARYRLWDRYFFIKMTLVNQWIPPQSSGIPLAIHIETEAPT
nr:MAG TPA: hypothetical protein [Caudoviricetes sp.]